MKLPLFTRSLATVVAGAVVVLAAPAAAQEAAAEKPAAENTPSSASAFDARITQELAIGAGLTSDAAARNALATSFDVRARRSEVLAAAAAGDEAAAAYLPRLTASARYTRLSDESGGSAGTPVAAPGAGPGPIPPGSQLVNVPLEFKSVLNQYKPIAVETTFSSFTISEPLNHDSNRAHSTLD